MGDNDSVDNTTNRIHNHNNITYIHIYIYMHTYVYIYIYIYTYNGDLQEVARDPAAEHVQAFGEAHVLGASLSYIYIYIYIYI